MNNKFLLKIAASAACLAGTAVLPANATLTLILDDGHGHTQTVNDGGSGLIVFSGALPGSVWNLNIDVAQTKPIIGGQFDPQLDVSIQSDSSTAAGTLKISAISDGFGPLAGNVGQALLVGGGASGGTGKSLTAYGLINAAQVESIGPFTTASWSGSTSATVTGLASTFSIGEAILITHTGAATGPQGDISFEVVPEPSTCVASALMLLPLAASAARRLRKKQAA